MLQDTEASSCHYSSKQCSWFGECM